MSQLCHDISVVAVIALGLAIACWLLLLKWGEACDQVAHHKAKRWEDLMKARTFHGRLLIARLLLTEAHGALLVQAAELKHLRRYSASQTESILTLRQEVDRLRALNRTLLICPSRFVTMRDVTPRPAALEQH